MHFIDKYGYVTNCIVVIKPHVLFLKQFNIQKSTIQTGFPIFIYAS